MRRTVRIGRMKTWYYGPRCGTTGCGTTGCDEEGRRACVAASCREMLDLLRFCCLSCSSLYFVASLANLHTT